MPSPGILSWSRILANQAKATLAVVLLAGALCLGDQGKYQWECLYRKWKGQEKRGTVFSVHLACSAEGAANILDRLLNSSWKQQPVCLVWQMQLVSNSTKYLEGVRRFQLNLTAWCLWQMKSESEWTFEIIYRSLYFGQRINCEHDRPLISVNRCLSSFCLKGFPNP